MSNKPTVDDQAIKKNNLISWEVEFKESTSEIEKIRALASLEQYTINELTQNLNFVFTLLSKNRYGFEVSFGKGPAAGDAIKPPTPPSPPAPHFLTHFFEFTSRVGHFIQKGI